MPHYDYRCADCQHEETIFQKISSAKIEFCPKCKKENFQRKIGGKRLAG